MSNFFPLSKAWLFLRLEDIQSFSGLSVTTSSSSSSSEAQSSVTITFCPPGEAELRSKGDGTLTFQSPSNITMGVLYEAFDGVMRENKVDGPTIFS